MASNPLKPYDEKRDFARTSEPPGEIAAEDGHRFVVQKHEATRLHYDFRLELDGVLLSWAVTRGPSLDPAEKTSLVALGSRAPAVGLKRDGRRFDRTSSLGFLYLGHATDLNQMPETGKGLRLFGCVR